VGLVHSRTGSGLILAEYGADGAAVLRALKEYDQDLRLLPPGVSVNGADRQHWAVYAYRGSERPPVFVLAWTGPGGEPLPLSMRLLDAVKEQDKNTRSAYLDADARNAIAREQRAEKAREEGEALVDDHLKSAKRTSPVQRSAGLRMARDRMRGRGEKA
jgi:hypothetical protein